MGSYAVLEQQNHKSKKKGKCEQLLGNTLSGDCFVGDVES